ncbi:Gfo/Idh/MocA family protein [Latilactobacillus sakei]|uniref:Oxidoreductase YvaA n=1 Tax=Latilactobacillus sakei TaxID=1599 RepID=A0AAE8J4A0_LATSK|nr:Gfo/Idh/MocA family oxidoreductase [Latilactobacillus sakei]EOR84309.1 oxidoreductase [Latilactobacillus sakei subsp. sakei LS25]PKX62605.1 gfo/Idh/MocA family oxidoreductase [Latilactobacillus sakei]PKX68657.1 gfo/Idh/MocA family oxidoreductase [Latilactobacillus sakei]SPE20410.1 putative oxidoreductase YvaA [Latilactobacillus sakei]
MQKLGIIGTNWITGQFVNAARDAEAFKLTAVYSRTEEKADQFKTDYTAPDANTYTTLDGFFESRDFETVYIASPNSLHFKQAKQAIEAGKNVIVEKPAFSNPDEMADMIAILADHPDQFLFEAARQIHEANFKIVQDAIAKLPSINGATLSYMKYSSRYDAVLAGEEPNIFSPHFSGGALQDLGVYVVYAALSWFGQPITVDYQAEMLPTKVDGKGVATLHYPDYDVTLIFGKTVDSYLTSEIYGGQSTIVLDNAGTIGQVDLYEDGGQKITSLGEQSLANPMMAEAATFATIIANHDTKRYHELLQLSQSVNAVLYQLRQSAGIQFDADQH